MKKINKTKLKSIEHLIDYFDQQVLAAYLNEPQKYKIVSDNFEGDLTNTGDYYNELKSNGKTNESISIRFGYRTLNDGNLAIVVWLPDLFEKSKAHIQRWASFRIQNPDWIKEDERFNNWVLRYLECSWDVDNGPLFYFGQMIKQINGITTELVGIPLFKHEIDEALNFPAAENTHRYQDSHKVLYGFFIDGLEKECIAQLGSCLGKNIKIGDKNTIKAIKTLFPDLETSQNFMDAINLVSEQRRLASHGVRPKAMNFPAFSQFTKDLFLCLEAIKELKSKIEDGFGVNGEEVEKRYEAKKWLPQLVRPPEPHYSIVRATSITGRTIEKVEFGFRKEIEDVHESEAIVIYFTDGSILGLETGSNAGNIASYYEGLHPEDFHVSFHLSWVSELPKGMQKK